ncbi:MAG TPA: PIG-L family deacetylase [Pseudomonadota bacterium]|nr:PIG-L family deacetylase [Pseudomonadota bacterium]
MPSPSSEKEGEDSPAALFASPGQHVFLSPHADDVAFSCAGLLATPTAVGASHRQLVTVFLSGREADRRRAEDQTVAKLLGCNFLCLELPDAPDRPEVHDGLDHFMPYGPPHLGIANEIVHRMLPRLAPPLTLYAPLAVGGHIDHRIVHEAARALAYHIGPTLRLMFYEDLPYALCAHSLARRLSALGDSSPRSTERGRPGDERSAYRRWLLGMPLVGDRLPGLRTLVAHRLAQVALRADQQPARDRPGFMPRLTSQVYAVSPPADLETQVIAAYASQWPLFARSVETLTRQLASYGQKVGEQHGRPPGRYQRLWQEHGAYGPTPHRS